MQYRGAQGPGENRNMLIAVVLSIGILLFFNVFFWEPDRQRLEAERAAAEAQLQAQAPEAEAPSAPLDRETAIAQSAARRVPIDTVSVDGSILLEGARLDDLHLRDYRETTEDDSPEVTLLSPRDAEHGFDAVFGWEDRDPRFLGVGARDVWRAEDGARLTQDTPLTLRLDTGDGLEITRTIAVDANYMFTITDEVRNVSGETRSVRPFGVVRRNGLPEHYRNNANVHQGFIGVFGPEGTLHNDISFNDAQKHARDRARGRVGENERIVEEQGPGGWLGITDHYWLTAIIAPSDEPVSAYYDAQTEEGVTDFRAAYRGAWRDIAAGESVTYTQRAFAGAKEVDLLQAYQEELGIRKFDDAVDWGNLMWPLTRPYFLWLLHPLSKLVGSFALGILLSTVVIKLALFPLVYQSYKSMARMRAIQPKMKEIQERYAADKARQQQEVMRLMQTEKVNPVSGCLPMLMTIPVFFALYKTLSVTIEMRHTPFVGWVEDMSATDPTTIFNLFGLIPWDPSTVPVIGGFLMIGLWPLLYGVSMWALQALSPPPTDPMQARIFQLLPILFTIMFASFPAGLVIYWTWSNILTIVQQYVIMRRQGVETQLDKFIAKRFGKAAATAAE